MAAGTCGSVSGCAAVASSPPSLIGLDVTAEPHCPRRRGDRIAVFFSAMRMSAFGTKRTCQTCRSMSAFGGKADIAPVMTFRPLLTQSGHRPDRNVAAQQSPTVAEVCYPFCRKHGRHRSVKRREFITLLG